MSTGGSSAILLHTQLQSLFSRTSLPWLGFLLYFKKYNDWNDQRRTRIFLFCVGDRFRHSSKVYICAAVGAQQIGQSLRCGLFL